MSNDLIQKNAELGRFLFCERYTLQPVKNALYIAEGQDLKRGAVVDVNGVLLGTNSLMPYAVLENDCDTRAKGAFASVFIKGEFNFDKLFFADGLSNEDLDNIVYNGSGIGLVIKPYEYAKDFTPKQEKQQEQIKKQENINRIILDHIYNPLGLPDKTIRCKFTSGYTPTMGTSQTLVDADENVWDITKNSDNLYELFRNNTNLVAVIGANTSSITNMDRLFQGCTSLTSVSLFDTSKVTTMQYLFRACTSLTSVPLFDTSNVTIINAMLSGCTSLTSVPLFDTSKATFMYDMFLNCTSLTKVPLLDTSKATSMYQMFSGCTSVESGALALYQQASTQKNPPSATYNAFKDCGSNTITGAAELAQIPVSWGGTAAG